MEIDESSIHVDRYQPNPNSLADVNSFKALNHFPLNWNSEQPHPGTFPGCTRYNRIKFFSDTSFQQKRCRGFLNLPFDFVSRVFGFRTMRRQGIQFILAIRLCFSFQSSSYQALGNQVGITPVRSGSE